MNENNINIAETFSASEKLRNSIIVRTSCIGIAANVSLSILKAAIGLKANSMALVIDAVNNLSDALSSVAALVGIELSNKKPDKNHPLGFGRFEHLTTMIISAIVIYAGITALLNAVKKILIPGGLPDIPKHSKVSVLIIVASVLVKLSLGWYFHAMGKKASSPSLLASGTDAFYDALLSSSVLFCAILFILTGINLEAWVSIIISIFIIKAGFGIFRDSVNEMLGRRFDPDLLRSIRRTICEDEDVLGAYELILHNYGPKRLIGSVIVMVRDTMTAREIDFMQRRITDDVFLKHGVLLTGIGIYSDYQDSDDLHDKVLALAIKHDGVLQIHGFFADEEHKQIGFDLVIDFSRDNRNEIYQAVCKEVEDALPEYTIHIRRDIDF